MNRDITYCNGKNCALKTGCRRFTDGQRILNSHEEAQWYWMENCDPEMREGFVKNDEPQSHQQEPQQREGNMGEGTR